MTPDQLELAARDGSIRHVAFASVDDNNLGLWVTADPPAVTWCDGPRAGTEVFSTLGDAMAAFAQDIQERLAAYPDEEVFEPVVRSDWVRRIDDPLARAAAAANLGLPGERDAAIRATVAAGHSKSTVAERTGLSRQAVYDVLNR